MTIITPSQRSGVVANNDKILLHPKYGLNPALTICPLCSGETNEIALLGAQNVDGSRTKVPASQPCEKCIAILERTNIAVCPKCRRSFECELHRVLKSFSPGDFETTEEAIEQGFVEPVTGQIAEIVCEECE